MGFFDDGDVLQRRRRVQLAVFAHQHQQEHHRQRLVLGAQIVQFQDDRPAHEFVQRVGALGVEHAAIAAAQQFADAPAHGGADVVVGLAGVAARFRYLHGGAEHVAHCREGQVFLAARVGEAPALVGVDALQALGDDRRQDAELGQGGVEAGAQAADVGFQAHAIEQFKRIETEGHGAFVAQGEDE